MGSGCGGGGVCGSRWCLRCGEKGKHVSDEEGKAEDVLAVGGEGGWRGWSCWGSNRALFISWRRGRHVGGGAVGVVGTLLGR